MPNHVTHRMTVTGSKEAIDRFMGRFLTTQEETRFDGTKTGETFTFFDFEKIIPMPEVLKGSESSSAVADGLAILGRTDIPGNFGGSTTLEQMLSYAWVKEAGITTTGQLKEALLKRCPDAVKKAEAAIKAYEECGHASWYSWSIEHWGTKWNSYDNEIDRVSETQLDLTFQTAWSTPEPVLEKMAELAPDIDASIVGFDEGWNFAFMGQITAGTYLGQCVEATPALYERVYGEAPEMDEEEA